MKRYLLCLSAIFLFIAPVMAQQYGNEWIDRNNTNPYFKVKIAEEGIYRINHTVLDNAVTQAGFSLNFVNPQDFQIFHNGEQIHIYVEGEADGNFGVNDFIEFYANKNDGRTDRPLYKNELDQPNPYYSLFNDTASYYLTWSNVPGSPKLRLTSIQNNLSNPPPKENYCLFTILQEYHSQYQPGMYIYASGEYLNSSQFVRGEGFTDARHNKSSKTKSFPVENIYTNGPAAKVQARVASMFDQEHRTRISLNNNQLIDTTYGGPFQNYHGVGQFVIDFNFNVPLNQFFNNGQNDNFTFEALGTGSSDNQGIGYLKVTYPRTFNFGNKSLINYKITGAPFSQKYTEISNFNHQNQQPILYERNNHFRMKGTLNNNLVLINIPMQSEDTIDLLLSSESFVKSVAVLEKVDFIDYSKSFNQGDYIIITNKKLRDDGSGNDPVAAYAQYRSSLAGGSFTVQIVNVEQLYEQFYYGIEQHPLSVRNFLKYAIDSFSATPSHVFIIGDGYEYNLTRTNIGRYNSNFIPTYGYPGSDNLLAATDNNSFVPQISIGRLAARNGETVGQYLDKVMLQEQNQQDLSNQTVEKQAWKKRAIHFGGGSKANEQALFSAYLNGYKSIWEDTLVGGNVVSFFKTSPDPIQYIQSQYFDSLITDGISLITFFGHSSAGSFDVNLDEPENYDNFGKQPIILSNGCFAGSIFSTGTTVSERFVLTPEKGAIGFLAVSNFGEVYALNKFTGQFYRSLSYDAYHESIGDIVRTSLGKHYNIKSNVYDTLVIEQKILHADPAVKLGTREKPDYAIESPFIQFNPAVISAEDDSFEVKVIMYNLGKAIDTVMEVQVTRTFYDQTTESLSKTVVAPKFTDTVTFKFATNNIKGFNLNKFEVVLDVTNLTDEITKMNNTASNTLFIESTDAIPVYPYEFSIVNSNSNLILKATTANNISGAKNYTVEIDTTEDFNSPIKITGVVNSSGGVISYSPTIPMIDSTVYYWRISPENNNNWQSSSFIYIANSSEGWNQSHYFQFLKDDYQTIELKPDRKFHFIDDHVDLHVQNGVYSHVPWDFITYFLNGSRYNYWSELGPGGKAVIIAVIDSATGTPWNSADYDFGEVQQSSASRQYAFHFPTNTTANREKVIKFLDTIPTGNYIMAHSFQHPVYSDWKSDSAVLGTDLFAKFEELGAFQMDTLGNLPYTLPFVFFVKKGNLSTAELVVGETTSSAIDQSFAVIGKWFEGKINSTIIGPAMSWQSFSWDKFTTDSVAGDESSVDIIGIDNTGVETVVASEVTTSTFNLSSVNAQQYPKLKLRMNNRDEVVRTPSQLDFWRINYIPAPEAAVNPNKHFSVNKDSLAQGEMLNVSVAVENISDYDMDSLLISYYLIDNKNNVQPLPYPRKDSLRAGDTMITSYSLNTLDYPGYNMLVIEVNPDNDQPEQYHFNNYAYISFYVNKDVYNPYLDVTFDGVHIMNGDIVSAKPDIMIKLKDENKYLALNDTALLDVFLKYPDGKKIRQHFDNSKVIFTPASNNSSGENTATINLLPELTDDGNYELIVSGRDRSGNESGETDYRVSFKVINKQMISNVLTYPNPFTSQTQFIFTLTGDAIPTYLKIQIMTVTGKVVREVHLNEIGPLHVGTNRTNFWWDGTDQYGDALANGLYLYRVVAKSNGEDIEHFTNNKVDKYFKSGIGKIYLAR